MRSIEVVGGEEEGTEVLFYFDKEEEPWLNKVSVLMREIESALG